MKSENKNYTNKFTNLNIIIIVLILTSLYAILRYNVFGNTPWNQLPLYILNKILSFSGLLLITLNLSAKLLPRLKNSKQTLGIIGFILIFIHILLSLILSSPLNYSKLYTDSGLFSAFGGISLSSGAIAFTFLLIYIFYEKSKTIQNIFQNHRITAIQSLLPLIHLFFLGCSGWITPQKWQGGMPPITLISFILYSVGLLIATAKRNKK